MRETAKDLPLWFRGKMNALNGILWFIIEREDKE